MALRLTIRSSMDSDGRKTEKNKLSCKWLFTSMVNSQWFPPFLQSKLNQICIIPNHNFLSWGNEDTYLGHVPS